MLRLDLPTPPPPEKFFQMMSLLNVVRGFFQSGGPTHDPWPMTSNADPPKTNSMSICCYKKSGGPTHDSNFDLRGPSRLYHSSHYGFISNLLSSAICFKLISQPNWFKRSLLETYNCAFTESFRCFQNTDIVKMGLITIFWGGCQFLGGRLSLLGGHRCTLNVKYSKTLACVRQAGFWNCLKLQLLQPLHSLKCKFLPQKNDPIAGESSGILSMMTPPLPSCLDSDM